MFLNLYQSQGLLGMKQVYLLSEELKKDPRQIFLAQTLTLDTEKPCIGLKGTHGLFGSQEWWDNIEKKKMPVLFFSGVICRVYVAGQDVLDESNTVSLKLDDGTVRDVGIYVNNKKDIFLFQVGHRVSIVYVLDELKQQPAKDGGVNYSEIALEMAVSLQPVK